VTLTAQQLRQFAQLCGLLQQWNRRVNLTAITETGEVYLRHFLDSLTVAPLLPAALHRLLDIGTGGGLPGLPLAIARPDAAVTLLEAHARKTAFLSAAVAELALPNVTVLTGRAETEAHRPDLREGFDVTVTRAVDTLAVLAEYQLPFCRIGGRAVAMKKGGIAGEMERAAHAIETLGGRLDEVRRVTTPGLEDERWLVVISKVAATPAQYPRRPGMPAKRPL
jgi:16S rRNA (guanine527-N7)-methyltransferase